MVDLKNLKKVKVFDIGEYSGMDSIIELVELEEIKTADFGKGPVDTRQIKISSANLNKEGKEIRAVEYISLKFDTESKEFGIPDSPNSKAMKFLKFFEVNNFDELKNKKCMIVKRVKGDKSFLGIHNG